MGTTMRPLYFAFTIDLDPDNFDVSVFGPRNEMSWKGVDYCFESFLPSLDKIFDLQDSSLPTTWFVRADTEIASRYGSVMYLFDRYAKALQDRQSRGDEIAWHPHTTSRKDLQESFDVLKTHGKSFSSVRVGNAFHSNEFMQLFSEWNFTVDSTALPGRRRNDRQRFFDWLPTSQEPYHPSVTDFRVPGKVSHPIMEVPMSMIPIQASYDRTPLLRYLDLSFHPELIHQEMIHYLENHTFIVSILHPSELLAGSQNHPLLSFRPETVYANLRFLFENAEKLNRRVQCITLSQVPDLLL